MRIFAIAVEELRLAVIVDASFQNASKGRSQIAYLMLAIHKDLVRFGSGLANIVGWRSKGSPRVCGSTLMSEAYSMSYGLAAAEWLAACICAALDPSFRVRDRANFVGKMQVQALMRDPLNEEVRTLAVTDAKSLYDNLVKEATCQAEKRAGLEICVCRESLDELNGQARWFPHDQNSNRLLDQVGRQQCETCRVAPHQPALFA